MRITGKQNTMYVFTFGWKAIYFPEERIAIVFDCVGALILKTISAKLTEAQGKEFEIIMRTEQKGKSAYKYVEAASTLNEVNRK